jgi:hypothetical protein
MNKDESSSPAAQTNGRPNLSVLVVPLLKGVVYQENDPELWNVLLVLRASVRDYVAIIGLDLILDEAEGYAFLRSRSEEGPDESKKLPRLVARRPLSFPVSLLLALLRKKLAEFDAKTGDTRLVLSRQEIVDTVRLFFPAGSNDSRLIDQIDSYISKVVDLGFMRPLKEQQEMFELKRILKAYVDAQWLSDFSDRLASYRTHITGGKANESND